MIKRHQRLSLDSLRLLDAIERQGSFAAAADELCVVTSSVTHAIRALEDNLGLTLFDRSGQRARFTTQGRALLELGRELMARADEVDAAARVIATGWEHEITLCMDEMVRSRALVPLVADFLKAAPDTSLRLLREAAAGSWDALISGRADLLVGAPNGPPASVGIECQPLFGVEFLLVVAPDHALAQRTDVISDAELASHRAIVIGDTSRSLPVLRYPLMGHANVVRVPDVATQVEALLTGIGLGFVAKQAVQPYVLSKRLVTLKSESQPPPGQSLLAWRTGEAGRALRWWRDHLAERGAELLN